MAARVDAGGGTGCARRWRERHLCSFLRHERMAVAMALAQSQHHSAPEDGKGLGRRYELNYTASIRNTVWVRRGGDRWWCSGTALGTWQTSAPSCRFSMLPCRSWWTSWMRSDPWAAQWPRSLSQCPRSLVHPSLVVGFSVSRRRRNSCRSANCLDLHPAADC